jgi:peptidoglycan hydrolase-like protein with peptidoglycan-binding domain
MTSPFTTTPGTNPLAPAPVIPLPAEARFAGDTAVGAPRTRARLVQEWLSLHGIKVAVAGDFGPATAAAVRTFQERVGLPRTGVVDRATFDRLVAPITAALQTLAVPPGATLGQMTVAYARQHLAQRPREVGGENRGPWVRLYMDGNEGKEWLWCSGFATFVQRQAAATLGVKVPVGRTFSCDELAGRAKQATCFVAGCPDFHRITPGSLFLVQKTASDWQHVGIVTSAERDAFHTIEGNTNDDGAREGYEVCERVRSYDRKDFVIVA